jgi:phosphatidylglycerophosphate synthase
MTTPGETKHDEINDPNQASEMHEAGEMPHANGVHEAGETRAAGEMPQASETFAPAETQPPQRARSIYSTSEGRFLYAWQRLRQKLLLPLAVGLDHLRIRPDMLYWSSVILGVGFFFLARLRFEVAFWLLVGSILLDTLDGVLARYRRADSTKGSFTDMFCDEAVVALTVGGLVWRGVINPVLGILFVYLYTLLVTLLLLHQLLNVTSQWIIRPSRMLLYGFVALYFFFGINWLDGLLWAYLLALPMLGLSYWRIRKAL